MFLPEPKPRELPPEGAHIARCFQVIDLGTQKTTYMGEESHKHQIQIGWEIPGELMQDGRPFGAFKTYTWSVGEKANLRKDLESWRGKKFTEADFRGPNRFNTKKLLGQVCILTIVYKTSADGEKVYANIATISPLPKGMAAVPPAVNKPIYLGLDHEHWNIETFNAMADWMKEKIQASPEYRALFNNGNNIYPEKDADYQKNPYPPFPGDRPTNSVNPTTGVYDPDTAEPDYPPWENAR